jgi:hypothetical protein
MHQPVKPTQFIKNPRAQPEHHGVNSTLGSKFCRLIAGFPAQKWG